MSYLVLARKYRPQTFDDVVGQEHVARTLQNAIRMNRVAHAFLFTGARGVGKTSTARIFAKALNCARGPAENPCNECPSCLEITAGNAMDVFEIDGASNRGIGEIRDLREGVKYAPSRDRYKIYIIDEVHMLTGEAFNALLKTLEEPPRHVIFFFATTEPQKIPVTILSRCQRYDLKRVPARALMAHLQGVLQREGIRFDEEALHLVARESEGSVRDSLSLLDQIIAYCGEDVTAAQVAEILGVADRTYLFSFAEAVFARDAGRALGVVRDVHAFGYELGHFASEVAQFFRNLTVIRLTSSGRDVTDLSESEFASLEQLATRKAPDELHRLFQVALDTAEKVASSRFPKLTLEMMAVRMASMGPVVPVDGLIRRLQELEKALPEGYVVAAERLPSLMPSARPQARVALPSSESPPAPEAPTAQIAATVSAPIPAIQTATAPAAPMPPPSPARPALRVVPEVSEEVDETAPPLAKAPDVVASASASANAPIQAVVKVATEIAQAPSVEAFRQRLAEPANSPLAAKLKQARMGLTAEGTLELAFNKGKGDFFADEFKPGESGRAMLERLWHELFGQPLVLRVSIVSGEASVETAYEEKARKHREALDQRRKEVAEHPAVKRVQAEFGGKLMSVKLAGEES